MKMLVTAIALLLVAACSETDPSHAEAASAIGVALASRLAEPLTQAAHLPDDADPDLVMNALDTALDDLTLPPDVYRIVEGTHSTSTSGGGYADVALALVVVPTDTTAMFCMVFASSSTGDLVAEPAPGDPVNRCDDTDIPRLTQP